MDGGYRAGWCESAFQAARARARAAGCAATAKAGLSDAVGKSLVCRQEESAFNAASSMAQALHGAFQGMDTDFDSLAAASAFVASFLAPAGQPGSEAFHGCRFRVARSPAVRSRALPTSSRC